MSYQHHEAAQRVVEIGDRHICYVDQGAGDPVVLLHGIPTWSYLWSPILPSLSASRRVLAPDLLGFGLSDRRDRFDRSIARQAQVILDWIDALGIERADLVGHDIGGGVALRIAALWPERVGKLCLMDSVCYDNWPVFVLHQLGYPRVERLPPRAVLRLLRWTLRLGFAKAPPEGILDGLLAPYATEIGLRSLIRGAAGLNTSLTTEITPLLSGIQAPTRILWGEDDRFLAMDYAQRLSWDIPGAELIRVRDAGHFVMIDQPGVVARHLDEHFGRGVQQAEAREPLAEAA